MFGNGTEVDDLPAPVRVSLTEVVTIASGGNSAYAVRADGTVWAWGANYAGQLGNGQPCTPNTPCESRVPVQVTGLTGGNQVAAGIETAYAVRDDGTAWAWGRSNGGQLGNGVDCVPNPATCESRIPVQVSGLTDGAQVASFDYGGYALRADGALWAWGNNDYRSLGNDNVFRYSTVPVRVIGLTGVNAVAGGWLGGYAVVPTP